MTLMNQLMRRDIEPFDILFKNFFDNNSFFTPALDVKPNYPVNIYEADDGLKFEIAVVGIDEENINIEIKDGNVLNVSYQKPEEAEENDNNYICRTIANRSFSLGWRVSSKYDLDKIEANVDKGLLTLYVPEAPDRKPKKIEISNLKKLNKTNKK